MNKQQRGVKKFNDLFINPIIDHLPERSKGRNKELDENRNKLLVTRYWYYGNYSHLRYELVISKLCEEFFLSNRRITDIISQDDKFILSLRKGRPSLKELSSLYPFLVWKDLRLPN